MIEIIPSILVQNQSEFEKNYFGLRGSVSMIQIDIADGKFVPNTTWADPVVIQKIVESEIELHLMVENPILELQRWEGVHQVKRVYFHYESVEEDVIDNTIYEIREAGFEVGVALKPETSIEVLEPIKNDIDAVLFLSVIPGRQGQPFIPAVLDKIKDFRSYGRYHFVGIDGGVSEENLPEIIQSGVDAICPGSAIFGNGETPEENILRLREEVKELTMGEES